MIDIREKNRERKEERREKSEKTKDQGLTTKY